MAPPIESAAVYNMSAVAGEEEAEKSKGCWRGGTEGVRESSEGEGKLEGRGGSVNKSGRDEGEGRK